MPNRYVQIASMAALLTAVPSLAQPQTTDPSTTGSTSTPSTSTTDASGAAGTMSTPATNPGGTVTGTATDTTTGSEGMHGTFRGSSASDPAATGNAAGTPSTSPSTANDTATATSAATATGGATAGAAAGSSSLQGDDATFLQKALEGDRLEIASAQQALDNAQRSDTKAAARMLLDDHQQSSQQLQQLASRKGWSLPATTATVESDEARMTSMSGSGSYDDRFMADQIRMHREAISLYRAQASSGTDPELRQFARDQLPHLEHHLEMLQGSNTQK